MRPFRWVNCVQNHKTSDCPKKDRNTFAVCALCEGAHPTNYKGCEAYKEILSKKTSRLKSAKASTHYNTQNKLIRQPNKANYTTTQQQHYEKSRHTNETLLAT